MFLVYVDVDHLDRSDELVLLSIGTLMHRGKARTLTGWGGGRRTQSKLYGL